MPFRKIHCNFSWSTGVALYGDSEVSHRRGLERMNMSLVSDVLNVSCLWTTQVEMGDGKNYRNFRNPTVDWTRVQKLPKGSENLTSVLKDG